MQFQGCGTNRASSLPEKRILFFYPDFYYLNPGFYM